MEFTLNRFNMEELKDDKVVVFGAKTGAAPTAVAGGLYYSGSDHFFLGFEGSGLP